MATTLRRMVLFLTLPLMAACSQQPTQPSSAWPSPGAASAQLAIEDLAFVPVTINGVTFYQPTFRLRETNGVSGAVVDTITLTVGDRSPTTARAGDCIDSGSIPAGSTWSSRPECFDRLDTPARFTVHVRYYDDRGRSQEVSADGPQVRPPFSTATNLALVSLDIRAHSTPAGTTYYVPWASVTETTGTMGATIVVVLLTIDDGWTTHIADSCLLSRRVDAGGVWSFDNVAYYCLDSIDAPASFKVTIEYRDDQGRTGWVSGEWKRDDRSFTTFHATRRYGWPWRSNTTSACSA